VRAFAGKDATDAFISYHRRNFPHHLVKDALVGSKAATRSATFDKDYLELCAIIDKVLPRHKSFAPPSYYAKIALLLGTALALEVYFFYALLVSRVLVIYCIFCPRCICTRIVPTSGTCSLSWGSCPP